ncbi:MAG: S8 family serine peptidase [Gaiellaceae bacterium]
MLALGLASPAYGRNVEVVVTLKQPPLAAAFQPQRSLAFSSFARPHRLVATTRASRTYLARLADAQRAVAARVHAAIPTARTRWRYGVLLNGFAVVVPQNRLAALARVPGVAQVWPSLTYRPLLDQTPQIIGAPTLWGPTLGTAGQGMKIAIIDDGIDQTHPFFSPAGFSYPPGFPKGQTAYTTPKVIVARAFPPASPQRAAARLPFEPDASEHGEHVAGIAAGDFGTATRSGFKLSGIAPRAYLGNYRGATIPSTFGLNMNSPEIAAAVEAAVKDGMDVINISFGETEIEPTRDLAVVALNAAADAGVVSTVSAGNEFETFGIGSINSPGSAPKAITVGASTGGHGSIEVDTAASFSSAGPTPYSLQLKPDVMAPGDAVASSVPGGGYAELSGTSMAAPHVAGAVAVLRQRHPAWTPAQVKSALMLTGVPVKRGTGEVSPLREGGGRIDLVRADTPLVFTSPSDVSLGLRRPGASTTRTVQLSDAGGGAGTWSVSLSTGRQFLSVPPQVAVPGGLRVTLAIGRSAPEQEVSGFILLSRGTDARRVPFWFRIERPRLPLDRHLALRHPGQYRGNTARGAARVSTYRYPEIPAQEGVGLPINLSGREVVYRVHVTRPANFGVAITSRARGVRVEPRVVRAGDENRLAGLTALPLDQNPYRSSVGRHRLVAGVVRPAPGIYDIVFDTPRGARAGPFAFRYWINDTMPPSIRLRGVRGRFLEVAVLDRGSGVDPTALHARIDNRDVAVSYASQRARVSLAGVGAGRHTLTLTASDMQETKNMESVPLVLPNTRTMTATFVR